MEHRDKRARSTQSFKPLDVHDDQRDTNPPIESLILGTRTIPRTTLSTWGPPEQAAAIALVQTEVTEENEELIRTYHPAFIDTANVKVRLTYWRCGRCAWVINSTSLVLCYSHAAGLHIYMAPTTPYPHDRAWQLISAGSDSIFHTLNPRRILTEDDLDSLRSMYPGSCGVRTWLSGTVEMLYPTTRALYYDQCTTSDVVGGSPVQFNIIKCHPSSSAQCGQVVVPLKNKNPKSCIGLKLTLPDGQPVLTAVTHGFVRTVVKSNSIFTTIANAAVNTFWAAKDSLLKFRTPGRMTFDHPYVHPSETPTSNSALGKEVQLLGGQPLGKIAATFDSPSQTRPYPVGFQHDLSLIYATSQREEEALPTLSSPAGLPVITGWGSITDALDGQPMFVTSTVAYTSGLKTTRGYILTPAIRRMLKQTAVPATAEAVQYTWDRDLLDQSISLLWRSVPAPEELQGLPSQTRDTLICTNHSVQGQSGSVLCLGKTTDATTKALLFQNFELSHPTNIENSLNDDGMVHIKGGFLLPRFISTQCTIHHDIIGLNAEEPDFSTGPRAYFQVNKQNRSFSGPI